MKIFLVRHGQSENNAIWENTQYDGERVPDPQLTMTGKKQIEASAEFLYSFFRKDDPQQDKTFTYRGEEIRIYCSLMDRAIQSGLIISQKLSLPLNAHLDIHENGGLYIDDPQTNERIGIPGRNMEDLRSAYPGLILPEGINPDGWWNRPFEERETRRLRAKRVFNLLMDRHGKGDIILIIITHGGFYNYLLRTAFELRDDADVWFDLYNAAITLAEITADYKNLIYCNRFDFIPKEIVT